MVGTAELLRNPAQVHYSGPKGGAPPMLTNAGEFKDVVVNTLDVRLDALNPRIDVAPDATQEVIRAALLQTEGVRELAEGIIQNGGLLPGERVIVVEESSQRVVLEGNRRICACQLLLDRSLIPHGHKAKFPAADGEFQKRIAKIQTDVSPDRPAAEYLITTRHTEPGIKKWSIVAKQRRIARYLQEGHTLEEAAKYYGEDLYQLKRAMQGLSLLRAVRGLSGWSADEKRTLQDPLLTVNPFIRFFQLKGTKDAFGVSFDDDAELVIEKSGPDFDKSMENVARTFLLPDKSGKRKANTRATPEDLLPELLVGELKKKRAAAVRAPNNGAAPRRTKPSVKPTVFFEKLKCHVQDDRLAVLSKELRDIDHDKLPVASAFLVRALVEAALEFCIRQRGLSRQLHEEWKVEKPGAKGGAGLDFMLRFALKQHDVLFVDPDIKRPLSQWLGTHKDGLDMVIHGKFKTNIDGATLEQVANHIHPAMQRILDGSALRPKP
jgi:hypothetical protein